MDVCPLTKASEKNHSIIIGEVGMLTKYGFFKKKKKAGGDPNSEE